MERTLLALALATTLTACATAAPPADPPAYAAHQIRLEANLPEGFPAPGPAGKVVVKHYPAYRAARATGRGAFGKLFRHISRHDIAMTAPVEMTLPGPDAAEAGRSPLAMQDMYFMYAAPDMGTPGVDGNVEVRDLPAQSVLSLGHFGRSDTKRQQEALATLHAAVAEDPAWELAGPPRRMGYSSPFVPEAKRYWEIQVPVRAVEVEVVDAQASATP